MIEYNRNFNIPKWPSWTLQGKDDSYGSGYWCYLKNYVFYYKTDEKALYFRRLILTEKEHQLFDVRDNYWHIIGMQSFDPNMDVEVYMMETVL